jgi:hypothetical protein
MVPELAFDALTAQFPRNAQADLAHVYRACSTSVP